MSNNTRTAAHTEKASAPAGDPAPVDAETLPPPEPTISAAAVEGSAPTNVDQPTISEQRHPIAIEFVELRHSTQELAKLFTRMSTVLSEGEQKIEKVLKLAENLGVSLVENEYVSAEDATMEELNKTIHEHTGPSKAHQPKQTAKSTSGRGGRRFYPRPSIYPRKPNWVLKVMR